MTCSMKKRSFFFLAMLFSAVNAYAQRFEITEEGYFKDASVNVMAFSDFYPEGHQGGIGIIMNDKRIATNGDLRLEETPGQWQPLPRRLSREIKDGSIVTTLCYPDSSRHLSGFNPMIYPDYVVTYTVKAEADGDKIIVTVDLDKPVPDFLLGKVGFNLEFCPVWLYGKPWIMDGKDGIYPQQPNSPLLEKSANTSRPGNFHRAGANLADINQLLGKGYSPMVADDIIAAPYAVGRKFTSRPDDPLQKVTVESLNGELKLYDGRMNHNNGWFVLRSEVKAGATKDAVKWVISPNIDREYRYKPVVQTSQIGYLPAMDKVAVIELDERDGGLSAAKLVKIGQNGEETVFSGPTTKWGKWLRYNYLKFDFSAVKDPGLYQVVYGDSRSPIFRINEDVFDRGVWQPVVEYFLPVQMCHMEVREKYRVWHGACHMDDAKMAPAYNHIDGYTQAPGISPYKELEDVPGVNIGGWHDAGDFDLRIESQTGESYILTLLYEAFLPDIDVTAIDMDKRVTEIHQPDGKNDVLQQVENGALSVVASYHALGRFYRGIICNSVRQYVLLGDAAAMTDGIRGNEDDRWIFTENNPGRTVTTAAHLAAISRVMKGHNDKLAEECITLARKIWKDSAEPDYMGPGRRNAGPFARFASMGRVQLAAELYLATQEAEFRDFILEKQDDIIAAIGSTAWYMSRIERQFARSKDKKEQAFSKAFKAALPAVKEQIDRRLSASPYGIGYSARGTYGLGWDYQTLAYQYYYLTKAYPDVFPANPVYDAVNYVLGCHPGSNQSSYASGVGAKSTTVAYGANRADWSYIPGGVASGAALIQPDFPELLEFPFLWTQMEYCMGGASSHYLFIVLAAKDLQN